MGRASGPEKKASAPEPPVTREAVCHRVDKAPVIDGKLDDPAWSSAQVIDRFPAFWDRADTGPGTQARLVWDDDALYFAATMTDAELRAFGTKHNDRLWLGDVFELFFKPFADRPEYYEFQVNPRSVVLELAFPKRGFDFATLAARPPMGMTAVAVVDGTLDQPGDRDRAGAPRGASPGRSCADRGSPRAGLHLAVRTLPLRLRSGGDQARHHELGPADAVEFPPLRRLRPDPVRRPGGK